MVQFPLRSYLPIEFLEFTLIKLDQSLIPDHRSQLGQESQLPKLIVEYFNKFGSKLVSYADILKYLDKLTNAMSRDSMFIKSYH